MREIPLVHITPRIVLLEHQIADLLVRRMTVPRIVGIVGSVHSALEAWGFLLLIWHCGRVELWSYEMVVSRETACLFAGGGTVMVSGSMIVKVRERIRG